MDKKIIPHIHTPRQNIWIFTYSMLALLPCTIAAIFYFGVAAVAIIFMGLVFYIGLDLVFAKWVFKKRYIWDGSSFVQCLVFLLFLPSTVPWWIVILGVFLCNVLFKQFFGGEGHSVFHPACAALVFLYLSFPGEMLLKGLPLAHRWEWRTLLQGPGAIKTDVVNQIFVDQAGLWEFLSGRIAGGMGLTSAFLVLACGFYLFWHQILRFPLFVSYVISILVGFVVWQSMAGLPLSPMKVMEFLFLPGILFGGVFYLNDYTTIAIHRKAKIILGLSAGFLVVLFMALKMEAYAVPLSILVVNLTSVGLGYVLDSNPFWGRKSEKKMKEESV